ncbi:MAG: PSD1 and planctomycete cytochrome C domain-containing protein [Gemmataceae bacterium]
MLLLLLLPHAVEFNRDVRPVLSEYCFTCHGPDTAKRKAGLRLDTADGGKTVLTPGKPAESELFQRLVSHEPKKLMPPAALGKKPTPAQVALIKRWIEEGAKYQPHWSLIAPARPAVPAVKDAGGGSNALDRFLLARIEAEGLKPSVEADRRVLLRRLSFDLLGLPPSPEDVDAFVGDMGEKAYERQVDRLLASRHFGERMALHWLDLVRYGDTGGYHSDNHRDISLYRDWVIQAFNDNRRFDAFTAEQLAGDLLPGASADQKVASGYNRMLMTTEEGGAQAKEYLAKYAADRVRNASTVWLGLTMGCCECHTHKYDPVTIKEFYQFAAFWADISEVPVGRQPQTKVPTADTERALAGVDRELAAVRLKLDAPSPALDAAQAKWEAAVPAGLADAKPAWRVVTPAKAASGGGQTLSVQPDGSVLAGGKDPAKDTLTFTLPTGGKPVTGLRLSALLDPSLGGTLTRGNGNFVLTKIVVTAPKPVKIARAVADFSQTSFPVESLLTKGPGWAVGGHERKEARQAVFAFEKPVTAPTLTVRLEFNSAYDKHIIGRAQLALTDVPAPGLGDKAGVPDGVEKALGVPADKRDAAQKAAVAAHFRAVAPVLAAAMAEVARLAARRLKLEAAAPQTLVSTSVPPRTMRVLMRGNWLDDGGEAVQPGVPASLPPLAVKGRATRLDLARWLTGPDHPLTARVFVNRLWRLFYGQGLVTTLDDFGAQGTHPSHPELLDWLAVEFRESGWDVKRLIRLMVTSSAYRQSSVGDAAVRAKDPANRLLARQARFRLDAEVIRDNALAVSGLLVDRVGGPSVKPYQPAGYWAYLNFPTRDWVADRGDGQYRRGLYTYVQRSFPHPSLVAFDAPSREECAVERPRSNTPQQALVLLNDPTYVEAARVLAAKAFAAAGDDAGRLAWAYRRVLGRGPREAEGRVLLALLAKHREQYAADAAAAKALLGVGDAPAPAADAAALAAWASVARTLLNLHETINRE